MWLFHNLQYGYFLAAAAAVRAQSITITGSDTLSISTSGVMEATLPTGSYQSYSSTITLTKSAQMGTLGSTSNVVSSMGTGNMTSATTASESVTVLQGTNFPTISATNGTISKNATTSVSSTSSPTSSSAQPTNTTPCNNYVEFCNRKYSNITMVSAHNSPFIIPGSVASNQELSVTTQLNDGIRMLQAQSHLVNGTIYLCHTSCDILNAGTLTSYLSTITAWVQSHPYDILTIIIENGDYIAVTDYLAPIRASGITQFVYTPPKIPMTLDDWPTLASMILSGQRVVLFMDYDADQTQIPWILDEFSQMWETPFDPTNRSFPCTVQRPPGLSAQDTLNRLYLMNHNLNEEVSLLGNSLLIPLKPLLPVTNNVSGYGSLGEAAQTCFDDWGRAPNFLNVDYYNNGSGSVFEVAAKWNNVTYNRSCCGLVTSSAERTLDTMGRSAMAVAMVVFSVVSLLI